MSNKKKLLGGGAAFASLAGIGYVVKQFFDNKKRNTDDTNDEKKEQTVPNELQRESSQAPPNYLGVKIELSDYYEKLLSELPEPKLVYKHFMSCLSTPRPSHKLDKMRETLKKTASVLGVEYTQDKIGNVCLKKKGSKGYENATGVVIQCHMDMVCTKTDDYKFDFDNDGIEAYISDCGEWLCAKGTTLGADDGIGVAAGLALMEHKDLVHGPLELLITADEETTLDGAKNLEKAPFLQNKILINVDSEESNRICIGCAGGFNKTFNIKMNRIMIENEYKIYSICISGLCGGHTGIQIDLGRANAIQLLCRILNYLILEKQIDVQLLDMNGGNAQNAIPSQANCNIVIMNKVCHVFEESVQEYWLNYILPEFKDIESKMHIDCDVKGSDADYDESMKVCDVRSSKILISLMMNLPHGVVRMSPTVKGLVQTSVAFSEMNLNKDSDAASCGLFARSMSMKEMMELNRKIDSLTTLFAANIGVEICECSNIFPGWEPMMSSSVALNNCKAAHVALYGMEADVYAVHAGLECGLIKAKYPKMDCVSIGPHIKNAHSHSELILRFVK